MVVDDLNIVRTAVAPDEAKAPLVVDANTMLSFSFPMQSFQAIPRRRCQVAQFCRTVQLPKLSACDMLDCLKAPAALAVVKPLGLRTPERQNHKSIVFRVAFNVKH